VRSLETARQCIATSELILCLRRRIFDPAPDSSSPSSWGLMKIVEGTNAPVIPVYLDGLWGSIFSFFIMDRYLLEAAPPMAVSGRVSCLDLRCAIPIMFMK